VNTNIDKDLANDIMDILDEHYYSLGTLSGHEAISAIILEFQNDQFDENLLDWEVTRSQFREIVFMLAERWQTEGKMWVSHLEFYGMSAK